MFGTFRYNAQGDDKERDKGVGSTSLSPDDSHAQRNSACEKCRSKKQRCSGQKSGCDRCKRTSSACVYSLDNKARRTRRRRTVDAGSRSSSPAGSSAAAAEQPLEPSSGAIGEPEGCRDLRNQGKEDFPRPGEEGQDTHELDEMSDVLFPLDPSIGSFDNNFILTDQVFREILTDDRCVNSSEEREAIARHSSKKTGESTFDKLVHARQPSVDLTTGLPSDVDQLSNDSSSLAFNIDSYLASPASTSLQPTFRRASRDDTNSWEDLGLSTLSRAQHGLNDHLSHSSKSLSSSSQDQLVRCPCLRTIGVLLEDFERRDQSSDPATLDLTLGSQKEALARCNSVLRCSTCVARSEYIMLLGLITERLVTFCESIVSSYLKGIQRRSEFLPSSSGEHGSRTPPGEPNKVFLGRYEIESIEEWSSLFQVIIIRQLRTLCNLLEDMKRAAAGGTSATHLPMVRITERKVRDMMYKLQQREPHPP